MSNAIRRWDFLPHLTTWRLIGARDRILGQVKLKVHEHGAYYEPMVTGIELEYEYTLSEAKESVERNTINRERLR